MGDVQSWVAKLDNEAPATIKIAEVPVRPPDRPSMEERLEKIAGLIGQCPMNAPYTDSDKERVRQAYYIATGEEYGA